MLSYRGRFAPSPTGPLHAGSVLTALASWLDARAHQGTWLVRIEDVDGPRCPPDMGQHLLAQLAALGLISDEPVWWQSQRSSAYAQALAQLHAGGWVYPCTCSRQRLAQHAASEGLPPDAPRVYPGWCRPDTAKALVPTHHLPEAKPKADGVAWRCRVTPGLHTWVDRRLGTQRQDVAREVGDFVVRRSDGYWAYQLAVVVDDRDQGITHVVRGEDLADNTPRQRMLCQALSVTPPVYWHGPLVRASDGQKLSKQTGAVSIEANQALQVLRDAALGLGLPPASPQASRAEALAGWVQAWRDRWLSPQP